MTHRLRLIAPSEQPLWAGFLFVSNRPHGRSLEITLALSDNDLAKVVAGVSFLSSC